MSHGKQNTALYILDYDGPCPYCGFHLKHPDADKCPECGNTLEITLKTPYVLTGWFFGLLGLTSSIVIFLVHMVFQTIGSYMNGLIPRGGIIIPEALIVLVLVFVSFVWVFMYQWFSDRKNLTKVVVGIFGVLLPFGMYQILMWIVLFK